MKTILSTVLLVGFLVPFGGKAHRLTEEGNGHYEDGNFEEALRAYTEAQVEEPEAPELFYDVGNVLYRKGDFIAAEEAYRRALGAATGELVGKAAYNLGNGLYRQENFEGAAREYRRALQHDPTDEQAKRNLELALRRLEEQQQQQQPQQQQGQQQDQDQQEQPRQQQPQQQQPQQQQQQEQQQKDQTPRPAPQRHPGSMTPEEAERLLDSLEQQEHENREKQAVRRGRSQRKVEKDW